MNVSFRIGQLLKAKNMNWKDLSLPSSTVAFCKKNNRYTTDQLLVIATDLGVPPFQLLITHTDKVYTEQEVNALLTSLQEEIEKLKNKKAPE